MVFILLSNFTDFSLPAPMSLFQYINVSLILIILILLIRYVGDLYSLRSHRPLAWNKARKEGRLSREVVKMERLYRDKVRFFNWWLQIERLRDQHIDGAFAELGVYKGESARVIHHMAPERVFHLFDTFSGFSADDLKAETGEAATYTAIHFADTDVAGVVRYINGNDNIRIHQGRFPGSVGQVDREKGPVSSDGRESSKNLPAFSEKVDDMIFALVNIDADLYNPTKAGLEYFYPRLAHGGVILVHDYNHLWPGIVKAVNEFVEKIPENLILLPDKDGTAMIIRNK